MAKLMGGHLKDVGTCVGVNCPVLLVVEVGIATVLGKVSMGQCIARPIKGIAIAVIAARKSNINMHATLFFYNKVNRRHLRPDTKGLLYLSINFVPLATELRGIL